MCQKCAAALERSAKFCNRCGTRVRASGGKCPKCDTAFEEGARFCTKCGAILQVASQAELFDAKCSSCKHRLPKFVCGSEQSPYFQKTITHSTCCDFYLGNPAHAHDREGSLRALANDVEGSVTEFQTAITLGLPEDDELVARFMLGESLMMLAARLPEDQQLSSAPFKQSLEEIERALLIDRTGGYEYFLRPLNRARLRELDVAYNLEGQALGKTTGSEAAIAYLDNKTKHCDYLPSNPLLRVLITLGSLHLENGDHQNARRYYLRAFGSGPVDYVDESGNEKELRRMAVQKLNSLD